MNRAKKICCFLGGGSWATAIVKDVTENVRYCSLVYAKMADAIENIRTKDHNPNYLSSVKFNTSN